jgi:hypothetical protein
MARTRYAPARVPEELEAAARQRAPELAELSFSALVRVGLAVLAGYQLPDAINVSLAARQAPGPKPEVAA